MCVVVSGLQAELVQDVNLSLGSYGHKSLLMSAGESWLIALHALNTIKSIATSCRRLNWSYLMSLLCCRWEKRLYVSASMTLKTWLIDMNRLVIMWVSQLTVLSVVWRQKTENNVMPTPGWCSTLQQDGLKPCRNTSSAMMALKVCYLLCSGSFSCGMIWIKRTWTRSDELYEHPAYAVKKKASFHHVRA